MARNNVRVGTLSTFNSASLTGSYQVMNSAGFAGAPFLVRIVNGGTTAVTVSFDGTNDNELVLPNSTCELPTQQNAQPASWVCKFSQGTKVYVKGTAGTGTIGLSYYYQLLD